ncbi:MAG: biopolymer transporter ExbD [Epsilonproteobacteria bacterium]|nr:biopolymer transporter ExbD [Campylobacterota bacterium]
MYAWDEDPDLNITPLIDVMLVLMAIFMITIPVMQYQEQIELPEGSQSLKMGDEKSLMVEIDRELNVHYQNEVYTLETFPDAFTLKTGDMDKTKAVYVNADKEIAYENVIYLLKVVKQSGFTKASLLTL